VTVLKNTVWRTSWLALLVASSLGCVPQRRYDDCVAATAKARADLLLQQQADAARLLDLQQRTNAVQESLQDRDTRLSDLTTSGHNLQRRLDEATAMNQQLRDELQRLGKDADKMLADRGTLSKSLDDARARLDELRRAQTAAESRLQLFRDFAQHFKPLSDAGQLSVETRHGQPVMEVQGDLLFDEGRSELRGAGKGVLMEVARALQTTSPPSSGRRFLVTAAVDGSEARAQRSPLSSWDLTSARAVTVVQYLVSLGVAPSQLTAAAAGAFDPIAPNDEASGRSRNRRVEIGLMP
jgi:chemotaxis protein MotB